MLLARRLAGDWGKQRARRGAEHRCYSLGGWRVTGWRAAAEAERSSEMLLRRRLTVDLWHGSGMVGLYKHPSFVAVTNHPSVAFVFVTALRFPCFLLIYENGTLILLMTCNIRCKGNRSTNCKMIE